MLLDPPSMTGLPPGHVIGIALSRTRGYRRHGRRLIAIAVTAAAALSAVAGIAIAMPSGRGYAVAPIITLTSPFPASVVSGHPVRPAASPGNSLPARGTAPKAMPRPSATQVATRPGVASPSTTAAPPTATVAYRVVSRWHDEFEGEITVANVGSSAISGWQIVVALPDDQVTAFSSNAAGYVSNHVLLLRPAAYADVVPANGTLSVFFTAYGTSATPELCAFNATICE
jgi:hypothetical protein